MSRIAAPGKRLALRIAQTQVIATVLVAAGFAFSGNRVAALGVVMGGLAVTSGAALLAWRTLSGGVSGAETALMRLVSGVVMKWAAFAVILYLALVVMALDPLMVVCGVLAALLANLVAIGFKN